MITLTDDMINIMSHRKFLLIPMNPPIFDSKVTPSIVQYALVMSTLFANIIINPFL